jgi:hypothetical protein
MCFAAAWWTPKYHSTGSYSPLLLVGQALMDLIELNLESVEQRILSKTQGCNEQGNTKFIYRRSLDLFE